MANTTTATAKEVQMFWRLCLDLNSDDQTTVADALDELDVLRDYTDCPSLKEQCSRMLERGAAKAPADVNQKVLA